MRDLIPAGYCDIHSHVLPGIDDGAKTIEDTRQLTSELQQLGCSKIVTTPHIMYGVWENTRETIENRLNEAKLHLSSDLRLDAAAEYMLDSNFSRILTTEPLLTLKDEYLLVEMSYLNPPIHLHQLLFDIQVAGYIPVIAHPERYSFYHKNHDELRKLKNTGCKFQINLLSVVGYYGIHVAETAKMLVKEGLIDYAGSDVHHMNHIRNFGRRVLIKDVGPLKTALENNSFFI